MRVTVCIFGITIGLILSLIGFFYVMDGASVYYSGNYVSKQAYGGDAYTGIQNAAADTANNINDLGNTAENGFDSVASVLGLLTCATGLGFVLVSTYKLADISHKKRLYNKILAIGNTNVVTNPVVAPVVPTAVPAESAPVFEANQIL